jgi:glutathione S-transferase
VSISHYCEKVRWGLDLLLQLENNDPAERNTDTILYSYTEDAHPPAFHAFHTVPASDGAASSTPMVVYDDGKTWMTGSQTILQTLCPFLYPSQDKEEIDNLETMLDETLGPAVRCVLYHYLLTPEYANELARISTYGASKVESILFKAMLMKGIDKALQKSMNINETTANRSKDTIKQVFQELSNRLESQDYLVGNVFSAADLTFASIVFHIIQPPCMRNFGYRSSFLPPSLLELQAQLKNTLAGKHVLRMYNNHRPKQQGELVILRTLARDRVPWMGLTVVSVAAVAASMIAWQQYLQ